jgi:hypothetical protein
MGRTAFLLGFVLGVVVGYTRVGQTMAALPLTGITEDVVLTQMVDTTRVWLGERLNDWPSGVEG